MRAGRGGQRRRSPPPCHKANGVDVLMPVQGALAWWKLGCDLRSSPCWWEDELIGLRRYCCY